VRFVPVNSSFIVVALIFAETATCRAVLGCVNSIRRTVGDRAGAGRISDRFSIDQSIDRCLFSFYIRHGGYVFIGVSRFVCLLAGLRKNYSNNFHKIRWKGGTWATQETVWFWW